VTGSIFALSSGRPPAGIAVIRISGSQAKQALEALAGRIPPPRTVSLALLTDPRDGSAIDRGLILWLPGPSTVTGEDMAELHCHGGRAVIAAVEDALSHIDGLRRAEAGEFTRRAFENGRMDLNAVEGLSDLLAAETQTQRRSALFMAEGHFSGKIAGWRTRLLQLSAMVEAALDFSDEDDVPADGIEADIAARMATLRNEVALALAAPSAERLRDGIRLVLAGPPNAGKSTLLNALAGREAAIVSNVAGTTRDRIEVPAAIGGIAFLLTDTAGLRSETNDPVEAIGIGRAKAALDAADLILWLGEAHDLPRADAILVAAQADRMRADRPGVPLSAVTGEGMDRLVALLLERASMLVPGTQDYALHDRQRRHIGRIAAHLDAAIGHYVNMLLVAEELRLARGVVDELTGLAGTEDMLDQLFSGFCIGK
jgi:tRNA modification GTPase